MELAVGELVGSLGVGFGLRWLFCSSTNEEAQ